MNLTFHVCHQVYSKSMSKGGNATFGCRVALCLRLTHTAWSFGAAKILL